MIQLQAYGIGTTLENIVSLYELAKISNPEDDPAHEEQVILGSKKVKDIGSSVNSWRWAFLTFAKRDALRTYCPNRRSAWVYISSYSNEDRQFHTYYCLMVWPPRERQRNGKVLDFTINFAFIQEINLEEGYS